MKQSTLLALLIFGMGTVNGSSVVYNNIPGALPSNVGSLGYEATSTTEFGGKIQLAGTDRALTSASVVMSNWALESTYQDIGTSSGFIVPLTLSIYSLGSGNDVGSLIASSSINASINWRPEASEGCGGGWRASNNGCYNGIASTVSFSFHKELVPDQIIFGLSYNTQHYGASPTHAAGPYNSLNFGLSTAGPSVGSNPMPGTVYWNTSYAGFYDDGGTSAVGTFRQDANWGDYSGAISLSAAAVPEPSTWGLLGLGLTFLAVRRYRQ